MAYGFLDMDGLLVDFTGGACKIHGVSNPYLDGRAVGQYDLDAFLGMTQNEFWEPMDHYFWVGLEPLPDAQLILNTVYKYFKIEDTAILSCPSRRAGSHSGKTEWLEKYLPGYARRYIYTPKKFFCAGPDRILIDDFDKNVKEFNAAGGSAFLYPRLWNSRHAEVDQALDLLDEYLEQQCKRFMSASTAVSMAV